MSELEKNAADPYRQPLPRTPARRIADDAEAIRVARELAGLFAEEACCATASAGWPNWKPRRAAYGASAYPAPTAAPRSATGPWPKY